MSDKPAGLEKYASAIVGWNSDSVIDAIDGKENPFESPDGSPRQPTQPNTSVKC